MECSQTSLGEGKIVPRVLQHNVLNRLKYVGLFGLKNKKEVWRVQYMLAKIRKAARELLILPETDSRRLFEGKR
jgi:hypothetical protein